jgi:hypothetical protein
MRAAGRIAAGIAVAALACTPRPLVVTQPVHIAVEHGDVHTVPRVAVAWDTSFWHATTTLNFPVAWAVANTGEERQLIDVLQLLHDGRLAAADSTIQPLLQTTDTLVHHAARVTYDVVLSERSEWERLARFAALQAETSRDPANVEVWAPAFSSVHTRVEYRGYGQRAAPQSRVDWCAGCDDPCQWDPQAVLD